jgi:hypothetical protein
VGEGTSIGGLLAAVALLAAACGTFVFWVQPEVAKYAVSVGWNLDSGDSLWDDGTNCTAQNSSTLGPCPTGQDIANAVIALIGTPGTGQAYGIVLCTASSGGRTTRSRFSSTRTAATWPRTASR